MFVGRFAANEGQRKWEGGASVESYIKRGGGGVIHFLLERFPGSANLSSW
jgi:hypothetical protein